MAASWARGGGVWLDQNYEDELEAARRAGRAQALEVSGLLRARVAAERAAALADAQEREALAALLDARDNRAEALQTSSAQRKPVAVHPVGGAGSVMPAFAASAMAHLGALPQLRLPLNAFVAATLGMPSRGGGDEIPDVDAARVRLEAAFDGLMAAVRSMADAGAAASAPAGGIDENSAGCASEGSRTARPAGAGRASARAGRERALPSVAAASEAARGGVQALDARHLALAARIGAMRRVSVALACWRHATFAPAVRQRLREGAHAALRQLWLRRAWRAFGARRRSAAQQAALLRAAAAGWRRVRARRGWRAILEASGRSGPAAEAHVCEVLERVRSQLARVLQSSG